MATLIFGQGGSGNTAIGANNSVGPTGAPAPSYATELGVIAASGFLEGVSSSNPIRIDPTGTTTQPVEINDGTNVMGTMAKFGTTPGSVYALNINASIFAGTTALSATGSSLNVNITGGASAGYTDETNESAGAFSITVAGLYNGTQVVGLRGDASNNLFVNLQTALPAGTNIIGHIIVDSGTITAVTAITNPVSVAQSIAANLNATVVGTGTFAVQATDNLTEVGGSAFTLGQQLAAASLPVVLTAAQIAILTPPTAAAIGTAVSGDLLIGTQLASASVPVALPTATITTLTPPTAAAIAAAIVANPPTVAVSGNVAVTQSTSPWIVAGSLTHNNAVPAGNNIGALVGIASTVAPVYGAGDQVLLSTDLAGNLRVVSSGGSGAILGPQLSSASTSVVLAIDQQIVTNIQDTVGAALFGTNNALNVHLFGNEIFNLDGQGNLGVSLTSQVLGNNTTAPATVLMVGGKTVNQVVNATWTYVQGSVTAVTTAVTATVTLTNNPSQGNLVCIGISLASASVLINEMVVKDSNGNVYMASPSSPTPIQSGSGSCWLFYLLSAPANATKTITATWTGSGSGAIWADEFHISVGTAVFDKDAVGTASGNSIFQSTTIDSPSITPTYQGSLLYSTAAPSGGTGISAPTAGAALGNWTGASGAITNGRMSEYDLSATGTTSVNYTQGTAPWVAIAMSFYAAASPSIYSYDILPLGPTGRSVLVEGVPGGTAIPISVSIQQNASVSLNQINGNPVNQAVSGTMLVGIQGNTGANLDAVITASTAPPNGLAILSVNRTTAPSLTTGQSVAQQCDYQGSVFVKPIRRGQTTSQATTIASSAAATNILPVGGTGIFVDLASLIITVTPVASASAGIIFTASLSDGTNTYIYDMDTGANQGAALGGTQSTNVNLHFNPPLPAATAATQWTITLSVATVTVHITAVGILQKAS